MWEQKSIKKQARQSIRHNYWKTVAVCFLLAFLAGNQWLPFPFGSGSSLPGYSLGGNFSSAVTSLLQNLGVDVSFLTATGSKLAYWLLSYATSIIDNATRGAAFITGLISVVNQFVLNSWYQGLILLAGAVLSFLYWMFIGNLLRIGRCRFFLENRGYTKTCVRTILFLFGSGKVRHTAWIMLCRMLVCCLWGLTIIGGVVKIYQLRMVPYLLAENPALTRKECFALSRQMMAGNKWQAFLLDLSFVPFKLLSLLTLGFLNLFYTYPYESAAQAELYIALRAAVHKSENEHAKAFLTDHSLAIAQPQPAAYPITQSKVKRIRHLGGVDYTRHYALVNLILIFFIYCFAGWVWEVSLFLFENGTFVNRGSLVGPWLPVYGAGGVLTLIILKPFCQKPVRTFALAMVVCGGIEYFAGWFLETTKGVRYWDYDSNFLNIQGRICLESVLVFSIGACIALYYVSPFLDSILVRLPEKWRITACVILTSLFAADNVYVSIYPHTGNEITYPLRTASAPKAASLYSRGTRLNKLSCKLTISNAAFWQ